MLPARPRKASQVEALFGSTVLVAFSFFYYLLPSAWHHKSPKGFEWKSPQINTMSENK